MMLLLEVKLFIIGHHGCKKRLFQIGSINLLTFLSSSKNILPFYFSTVHTTHTKKLGVVMVCFPANTTHRLHSLDATFISPHSAYYTSFTISQIDKLFGNAYIKTASNQSVNLWGICVWICVIFFKNVFLLGFHWDKQEQLPYTKTVINSFVRVSCQLTLDIPFCQILPYIWVI